MAQSLNTKVDYTDDAIAYLGFAQYGKVMLGDVAFEFFDNRNVENNMQFPWKSIKRVEGQVSKSFGGQKKIGRYFTVVLHNEKKVRFSSNETGKILKIMREYLGNDRVVKYQRISDVFKNLRRKNKKAPEQ